MSKARRVRAPKGPYLCRLETALCSQHFLNLHPQALDISSYQLLILYLPWLNKLLGHPLILPFFASLARGLPQRAPWVSMTHTSENPIVIMQYLYWTMIIVSAG